MEEKTKQWLIKALIVMGALVFTFVWTKVQMNEFSYMLLLAEKQQGNLARQQQLQANELELQKQEQALRPLPCEPVEEEPLEEGLEGQ